MILDYLIGSLYYDSLDKHKHLRLVVEIEYRAEWNIVIAEILNGPYVGKKARVNEDQFFRYYVEIK